MPNWTQQFSDNYDPFPHWRPGETNRCWVEYFCNYSYDVEESNLHFKNNFYGNEAWQQNVAIGTGDIKNAEVNRQSILTHQLRNLVRALIKMCPNVQLGTPAHSARRPLIELGQLGDDKSFLKPHISIRYTEDRLGNLGFCIQYVKNHTSGNYGRYVYPINVTSFINNEPNLPQSEAYQDFWSHFNLQINTRLSPADVPPTYPLIYMQERPS